MKKIKYRDWVSIVDYILPLAIVCSVIEFILGSWTLDTLTKAVTVIVSLIIVFKTSQRTTSSFKTYFTAYIFFCLLTGLSYLTNGRPISCYTSDISDFILPMLFVYIGLADNRTDRRYYDYFYNTLVVVLLLGLVFYLLGTGWYLARMADVRNAEWYIDSSVYDEDSIVSSLRYCAFFKTSYPVSHLATFALSIGLFDLLRKDKDTKYIIPKMIILLVSIVLCQHRVALACGGLFIAFTVLYGMRHKAMKRIRPLIILVAVGLIALIIVGVTNDRYETLFEMLSERYEDMSVSNALKERKQIAEVFASWDNVIWGQGIGAGGAAARRAGFYGITDQNYAKLLYETGVLGCMLYAFFMFASLIRALKYYRCYLTELFVMVFISIAMLGSNSLVIYYMYIVLFWYAMGRVWNKQYLQKARQENIYI